jgi:hypothetical protein
VHDYPSGGRAPARAAATVKRVTDVFHPARAGRCPRCSAGGQETNVFCVECALRLRPGSPGLQAPARLLSEAWMKANPMRADHWLTRGEARSAHDLVLSLARAHSAAETPAAVEELECWLLHDRLFATDAAPAAEPQLPPD